MSALKVWSLAVVLFSITGVSAYASSALDTNFQITVPPYWKNLSTDSRIGVYKNERSRSNEIVVAHAFERKNFNDTHFENLHKRLKNLSEIRSSFMSQFGLGEYTILAAEKKALFKSRFRSTQIIQSRYVGLNGLEVQVLERHYWSNSMIYVVTYMLEAPALNNRSRAEIALNFFNPIGSKDRKPSSETVSSEPVFDNDPKSKRAAAVQPSPIHDLDMSDVKNQKRCESVPENKRRQPTDPSFLSHFDKIWGTRKGCFLGGVDFVKDILNLIALPFKGLWAGTKYTIGAMSTTLYKEYHDQVNATMSTIAAEVLKNPKVFAKRMASETYNAISKSVGDVWYCYDLEAQVRVGCRVLADLAAGGLLLKVILRLPLEAAEMARVSASSKRALSTELSKDEPHSQRKLASFSQSGAPNQKLSETISDSAPEGQPPRGKAQSSVLLADSKSSAPAKRSSGSHSPHEERAAAKNSRRALVENGTMLAVWRRPLSKLQSEQLTRRLQSDSALNHEYQLIVANMERLVESGSKSVSPSLQDKLMSNINKAIANLGEGESLNVGLFNELLDRAAKSKTGSSHARSALHDLKAQTELLRYVNAQSGKTLRDKLEKFLARVSLELKRVSVSEAQKLKTCLSPNRAVTLNELRASTQICLNDGPREKSRQRF